MNAANFSTIGYRQALMALVILLLAPAVLPAADQNTIGPRVSVVTQIAHGGRDGEKGASVRRDYESLSTGGTRAASRKSDSNVSSKTANNDFWFYDADVVLFGDDDYDGYYFGIDLLFDADTVYEAVDVYAVVFLSLQGGPWNEYAATDDFIINGATGDDEYVIVTELESGYPAADYDMLIELYDAFDGAFLASFGPADSSELSYLPLEDFQRDAPVVDNIVVVGHGGGGNGYGLLLLLLVPLARLMRRQLRAMPWLGA
ncbi:MAG: hypothetical protein HKN35_01385 [Woeseia sp.]|nr:choice-of-anchor H family protein [Woeseia sp.]MBT8096026.1 choice-of-anchor H family protein [Woeseia sp.]NNE59529.1 hypothetical protein [Woeseia sp.]NNL54374.1 hypothetical protein [Woeseia sp.]